MHCESCGAPDPTTDEDGYTDCCNEPACDGEATFIWTFGTHTGVNAGTVEACCSSVAQALAPAGMATWR